QARLWMLAGVAAYYLLLAARLDLRCGHCFAVHTALLAAVAVAIRGRLGWRWRFVLAALGALALHAGYHHELRRDAADASATPLAAADQAAVARIDRNRRRGSDQSPRILEVGIDLQCPACAELHDRLTAVLDGEIAAGRLQVVTRHLTRRSEAASGDLVRWALAAAAIDATQHRLFLAAMLGSRRGAAAGELKARAQELVDMAAIERALAEHAAAIDHVLALDQRRIHAFSPTGRTPIAALIDRAQDRVITAWDDPIVAEDIAAKLRATL
ncbi:MAG TPA: thioredoxin domain-containing protein, partial [Planctomycetota bacterium]|nr:thioredoxin domain-containing protein [Planctomycetota bacterium]